MTSADNNKQCYGGKHSFADNIIMSVPIWKIQDGMQTQYWDRNIKIKQLGLLLKQA